MLRQAARILSSLLEGLDRSQVVTIRERIDRKLIEPIRPTDLFYQVLHGLRSLTGYDHSASLYMPCEPIPLPYREEWAQDMELVAELLGPHHKSERVGRERTFPPELVTMLGDGLPFRARRDGDHWNSRSGLAAAALASALDSREDLGDYGRERSMICAPLISQDTLVGVLTIGFRHENMAGSYEAELVDDFVPAVVVALRNLHRLEHLRSELDAARQFQASLLPPIEHRLAFGTVTYRYRPCDQLGGDFFDVMELETGRTRVLLADVSGHGAKAAMVTGMIKAAFRDKSPAVDPAGVMREIWTNVRFLDPELMVTALCLEIDGDTMRWANAGHPAPSLLHPDGSVSMLEDGEAPIFASIALRWRVHQCALPRPGTLMLLTTDGPLEAEPGNGDEFGAERFVAAVRAAEGSPDAAPALRLARAFRAVDVHRDGLAQGDDYTAALLAFTPPAAG